MSLRISHGASLVTSRESGIDCFSRTPMKNEGKERKHGGARVLPVSKQDKHVATNFQPSFLCIYSNYTISHDSLLRFPSKRFTDIAKTLPTPFQSHSNSPPIPLTASLSLFYIVRKFRVILLAQLSPKSTRKEWRRKYEKRRIKMIVARLTVPQRSA